MKKIQKALDKMTAANNKVQDALSKLHEQWSRGKDPGSQKAMEKLQAKILKVETARSKFADCVEELGYVVSHEIAEFDIGNK